MPALKLQKRGPPTGEEWGMVGEGQKEEAGALDFKSRMFGWGLSSQINNLQPYSKQICPWGRDGSPYFHISSPEESHQPPLRTLLRGGMRGSSSDQGWAAAALGPGHLRGHHLAGYVRPESCQLTPSLAPS